MRVAREISLGGLGLAMWVVCCATIEARADEAPRPIATIERDQPIDFASEIAPILKANCLACHNQSKAESGLSLETRETILAGGDGGPAVSVEHPLDSPLVARARGVDSIMPPEENDVGAKPLTATELALVVRWIAEGAKAAAPRSVPRIAWQAMPARFQPVYALALSHDSRFLAIARANQVSLHHAPTGRLVGQLADPGLMADGLAAADLDSVGALAFSRDGRYLAVGGYRAAKIWERPPPLPEHATTFPTLVSARTLAASTDGRHIATGDSNGAIRLESARTGDARIIRAGDGEAIVRLAFVDEAHLAFVTANSVMGVIEVSTARLLATIAGPSRVTAAAPVGGHRMAVAREDGVIGLWRFDQQAAANEPNDWMITAKGEFRATGAAVRLATSKSREDCLFVALADGTVELWSLAEHERIATFAHGAAITALAASGDGQRLLTASADGVARLWSVENRETLVEFRGDARLALAIAEAKRRASAESQGVEADRAALAEAERIAKVEQESLAKARVAEEAAAQSLAEKEAAVTSTAAAQDALTVSVETASAASTAANEREPAIALVIANVEALAAKMGGEGDELGKAVAGAIASLREALVAAKKESERAAKAHEEAKLALATATKASQDASNARDAAATALVAARRALDDAELGSERATIDVASAERALAVSTESLAEAERSREAAEASLANSVRAWTGAAFSSDNSLLAMCDDAGLVHTFTASTGQSCEVQTGAAGEAGDVIFVDDDHVAACGGPWTLAWRLFPEWRWVRTIGGADSPEFEGRVTALAFSPDGDLLATGGGVPSRSGELKLWRLSDGALARSFADSHSDVINAIEFAHLSTRLATASADKFVRLFDMANGDVPRVFEGHTHHVLGVAWSGSDRLLASAGADGVVKTWNVASGEQARTITGFAKEVTGLAFLAETSRVAAASGDGRLRVCETADGKIQRAISAADDFIHCLAVDPIGQTIFTGGQDGVVRRWDAATGKALGSFEPPARLTETTARR